MGGGGGGRGQMSETGSVNPRSDAASASSDHGPYWLLPVHQSHTATGLHFAMFKY